MMKKPILIATILIFILTAFGIGALILIPREMFQPKAAEIPQTRIVIPQEPGDDSFRPDTDDTAYDNSLNAKIALEEGEILITVLTQDLDGDLQDDQVLAYRRVQEPGSPIYITYVGFSQETGGYKRYWSAPAAAVRPGTISLFSQDIIGDRSLCILVMGMDEAENHTLTVFRKADPPPGSADTFQFQKIAEIKIDGSISIQETERSQAYRTGLARGQSFSIAAYGRDYDSSNMLDQIEVIYAYNNASGVYEQKQNTRIPGIQIEQRRVRELLGGRPGEFEQFIQGLWYFADTQGKRQYIYFDPESREIVFYGDGIQQVFIWQNSSATRYGLYVSSQNISITSLRRFLDIELESLDSIRVKVFEDVRLKIGIGGSWDGSYRKMTTLPAEAGKNGSAARSYIDAFYESSLGKFSFHGDGGFEISGGPAASRGRYVFFLLDGKEFLELRPQETGAARETYLVERAGGEPPLPPRRLTLTKVRLGTKGAEDLRESPVSLSLGEGQ